MKRNSFESVRLKLSQEAVYAARAEVGDKEFFQLDSPATPEKLRMACKDHLTQPFATPDLRCKMSC